MLGLKADISLDRDQKKNLIAAHPHLNEDVFCHLIRDQRMPLFKFIHRRVNNEAHAEDILQATYLEAWNNLESFQGLSKPKTWLFGIALNLVKNPRFKQVSYEVLDDYLESSHQHSSLEEQHIQKQNLTQLDAFLKKLSKDAQKTIDLVFIQNNTYEKAAQILDVPIGTIRSRIARIRDALKQSYRLEDIFMN